MVIKYPRLKTTLISFRYKKKLSSALQEYLGKRIANKRMKGM